MASKCLAWDRETDYPTRILGLRCRNRRTKSNGRIRLGDAAQNDTRGKNAKADGRQSRIAARPLSVAVKTDLVPEMEILE